MLEIGLQRRQFGIDLLQLFLVRIRKFRAGADEIFVITLEQVSRLRIEAELVAIVVKLLDAGEQFAVEMNGVVVRGKFRRHFLVDLLQLGIGVAGV